MKLGFVALVALVLGGCAADCPKCRTELASLREEVTRLREDIAAVNALVAEGSSGEVSKRSTVVIGQQKDAITVRLLPQGIIFGDRRLTIETLSAHAAEVASTQPYARVGVAVDPTVHRDRVLQVLNMLKRAGLQQVYLHDQASSNHAR